MYHGTFPHSLDSKRRIFLPAKFRARLSEGVMVTVGPTGRLWLFDLQYWPEFLDRLTAATRQGDVDPVVAETIAARATDLKVDAQGRIRIPDDLLEFAGIGSDVVVAGNNDRIEVWDGSAWRARSAAGTERLRGLDGLRV